MGAVPPQAGVRDYPLFRKIFSGGEYCLLILAPLGGTFIRDAELRLNLPYGHRHLKLNI